MSKFLPSIMILFFLVAVSGTTSAQGFLNKLSKKVQDKIENKVEDKVDQKVDEKVDESLDKVFEGDAEDDAPRSTSEKQNERLQKMMKGIGMSGEPVPIENDYAFDSKLQMHIESYKKMEKRTAMESLSPISIPMGKILPTSLLVAI